MKRLFLSAMLACHAAPALSDAPAGWRDQVQAALSLAPAGTRFGVLVIDDKGDEVLAINADQRFIPASNTKLFTTAAALAVLGTDHEIVDNAGLTTLALVPAARGLPSVVLTGGGAALSTAPDCIKRCFAELLSAVATKAHKIGNIIADDTAFTDQRWSPGMSWNNIPTNSGTAASAIVIDDNELPLVVAPGASGQPPTIAVSPYFVLRNEAVTVTEGETRLDFDRPVNGRELRVFGSIRADSPPWREKLGIDDPADYAAWLMREGLMARGVKVRGRIVVRHRAPNASLAAAVAPLPGKNGFALAVSAAPLAEEVAAINKPSQNLRAEVLLRRIGRAADPIVLLASAAPPAGTLEAGLAVLRGTLDKAGIARRGYDFADGSGMSTYNRISPRAAVGLLRWGKGQSWGAVWRASLPVGGVDGTLRRRFAGTPLEGKVWAKTGTLNATNALSGYVQAASGRELTFSILANDVPDGGSAVPAIDAALLAIAAAN